MNWPPPISSLTADFRTRKLSQQSARNLDLHHLPRVTTDYSRCNRRNIGILYPQLRGNHETR